MQSLFTSQGESRPWSVQVLARRGRRYALATRGLSERTSREEWGWWGSSQWDRYNSKEIGTCLLLLRIYLASYDAMNISGLCKIQKRIKIKRPYQETLGRYPSKFKFVAKLQNLARLQNQVIDRGWGGVCLAVEATWQGPRQIDVVNDIRSLSSALDQVTDYIVLYNVSRETNNYKHNAWFQTREERSLCLHFA